VELWVLYGDACEQLSRQRFSADAWYFDGFNPADNPELWSPELIAQCARLMAAGAVGGSFTVASSVRNYMDRAGLITQKVPGFGRKRECLHISSPHSMCSRGLRHPGDINIIGTGIAAAALVRACFARYRYPNVYEPQVPSPSFASENPAALINFKPTRAPSEPMNRLLAAALAHVQDIYADLWLPGRGTFKPADDPETLAEFHLAYEAMGWGPDALEMVAGSRPGLQSNLAGYVRPSDVLQKLFDVDFFYTEAELISNVGPRVWANAFGAASKAPSIQGHMRRNLGQVDLFEASKSSDLAMPWTYGGYMTPSIDGKVLAGSTYDRDPDWSDPLIFNPQETATDQIIRKARKAGLRLPKQARESFVSARAFGKDHRPIVGQTWEGVWMLTGLGSRGFLTAPLLAEILLDEIEGRFAIGLPTYDFRACVHPSRFNS